MAPMPTARGDFGVAVVGGKIYAIGGFNGDTTLSTVEEYNYQTNKWTSKMPMPTPRSGFAIAVYHNKIFVIGGRVGYGYIGNNEVYDTTSNTWETKASMPTPRADLRANVVNDSIYLIGGERYSSVTPFHNETNLNEVYDPINDSWSIKTPIPTPVQCYASTVFNDKIYISGGSLDSLPLEDSRITSANQVYDPQNDSWSLAANLLNPESCGAIVATEGFMAPARLYYIGGFSAGEFSEKVQAYNLENNSWTFADSIPTPRAFLGVAILNDVLYALGGFDGTNWLDINEQYKPIGYGTVPPDIQVTSPENKTYSEVSVIFTVNRGIDWAGYSLDNQENVTIIGETRLADLSQGNHIVTIYANDSLGNMGSSDTIFFSVDIRPPDIDIMRPQNQSYDSTEIQFTFSVNEEVTYLGYSLDGQENVKILGNITLPALSNGSHRLTLYATDNVGNSAEKTVYFNIAPFPIITIAAGAAIITIILAGGYLIVNRRKSNITEK